MNKVNGEIRKKNDFISSRVVRSFKEKTERLSGFSLNSVEILSLYSVAGILDFVE